MKADSSLLDEMLGEVSETIFDPLAYAERFYPWGVGALEGSSGPRKWQSEILGYLRDHCKPSYAVHALQGSGIVGAWDW